MQVTIIAQSFASKPTKKGDKAITTLIEADTGDKYRVCAPEIVNDGKADLVFRHYVLDGFKHGRDGLHFASRISIVNKGG